jgi:hypothetical protein
VEQVPDGSEHIREFLRKQVGAIEAEMARVQAALRSLDGATPKASKPRQKSKARRGSSKRAGYGQRPKQFLAAAKARPKASLEEIAADIGVSTSQTRALARRLESKGQLKRSKQGFQVTTGA